MKKVILSTLFVAVLFTISSAQTQQDRYAEGYVKTVNFKIERSETASRKAEFPGGIKALEKYIQHTIEYPAEAKKCGWKGTVLIRVTVTEEGSLKDFQIVGSTNRAFDKAAMKAIKDMPDWEPALNQGEEVNSQVVIPVQFRS